MLSWILHIPYVLFASYDKSTNKEVFICMLCLLARVFIIVSTLFIIIHIFELLILFKNKLNICKQGYTGLEISVANTAVYPLNWATLKSPAAGQKTVGQVA